MNQVGPLEQVVGYGSLVDLERKRIARAADPAWGEFTEGTARRKTAR